MRAACGVLRIIFIPKKTRTEEEIILQEINQKETTLQQNGVEIVSKIIDRNQKRSQRRLRWRSEEKLRHKMLIIFA